MPERALHRLKSYQSGTSLGGDGDGRDDDANAAVPDGRASPSNSGVIARPFFSQFSLIGDAGDEDEVDGYTRRRNRWRAWCMVHQRLVAIVSLCLVLFVLSSSVISNARTGGGPEGSCPIRSSYSVPSEIMELKNSSAVENIENGAVATDHLICSQIGVSILRDGGNAADAAIASTFCLGVVNPSSSGIGGGAFILVHSDAKAAGELNGDGVIPLFEDARSHESRQKERRLSNADHHSPTRVRKVTEFVDCRETAPADSTVGMYEVDPNMSTLGGLASAIPGEVRGLELLHYRHGSMPWDNLVRPAMELARDGFRVEAHLAKTIREHEKIIRKMPDLGFALTKNNDGVTLLKEGDTMIRSQYAKTLEAIMRGGADALYQGDLAKMLAKDIQDAGGIITPEDMSSYRPTLRDPLISYVNGYNVVGAPPPSSGGATIIGALRFVSGFAMPFASLFDTLSQHWFVEACRHAFAIRMSLSDPSFAPEENANAVKDLIEGEYIETLRKQTLDDVGLSLSQYGGVRWAQLNDSDGNATLADAQEGDRRRRRAEKTVQARSLRLFGYLNDHGTTSLSVVDKNRNTVTITSSVNLEFGSKVVSPSTGIVLNNVMDDFSSPGRVNFFGLHPSEANYIAPGKRALSSMSPTMIFRADSTTHGGPRESDADDLGKLVMSLGGSGGPKIITSVIRTILNYAWVGMPLYESVSAPRIHDQLLYHGAAATNIEEDTLPQGPTISVSERTRKALKKRGHDLITTGYMGTVQAIAVDQETDLLTAVADIRKQGMPDGY